MSSFLFSAMTSLDLLPPVENPDDRPMPPAPEEDGEVSKHDHLLALPGELLAMITGLLSPSDLCRFSLTFRGGADLVRRDWVRLLVRFFPDTGAWQPHDSEVRCFADLSQHLYPKQKFVQLSFGESVALPCCGTTLLHRNGKSRCPCVCVRSTRQLALALGGLSVGRAGTSALSGGGFQGMLDALASVFDFRLEVTDELTAAYLARIDVFILCTTEVRALVEPHTTLDEPRCCLMTSL